MLFADRCQVKLDGRIVCITGKLQNLGKTLANLLIFYNINFLGANTGIGKPTAMDLSARGAKVLILCRNVEKAEAAAKEIKDKTGGEIVIYKCDLGEIDFTIVTR